MILNVAPKIDAATEYSYRWNQRLLQELEQPDIVSLEVENATRAKVTDALKNLSIHLFIFYDHGSESGLVEQGSGYTYLIDENNVSLLKGKEVFTMCCLAAKKLGVEAYKAGAKAWWGYVDVFSFTSTDEAIFSYLGNLGLILRIKQQLSWEVCLAEVVSKYNETIDDLREHGGNPWTITALVGNRNALACWNGQVPPAEVSDCPFRRFAVRIFGKRGWKIPSLR